MRGLRQAADRELVEWTFFKQKTAYEIVMWEGGKGGGGCGPL